MVVVYIVEGHAIFRELVHLKSGDIIFSRFPKSPVTENMMAMCMANVCRRMMIVSIPDLAFFLS